MNTVEGLLSPRTKKAKADLAMLLESLSEKDREVIQNSLIMQDVVDMAPTITVTPQRVDGAFIADIELRLSPSYASSFWMDTTLEYYLYLKRFSRQKTIRLEVISNKPLNEGDNQ